MADAASKALFCFLQKAAKTLELAIVGPGPRDSLLS